MMKQNQEIFRCPYCDKLHNDQLVECCDERGHVVALSPEEIEQDDSGEIEEYIMNYGWMK